MGGRSRKAVVIKSKRYYLRELRYRIDYKGGSFGIKKQTQTLVDKTNVLEKTSLTFAHVMSNKCGGCFLVFFAFVFAFCFIERSHLNPKAKPQRKQGPSQTKLHALTTLVIFSNYKVFPLNIGSTTKTQHLWF